MTMWQLKSRPGNRSATQRSRSWTCRANRAPTVPWHSSSRISSWMSLPSHYAWSRICRKGLSKTKEIDTKEEVMPFDAYLKIETPNITGESTDSKHKGEIEIYSFSLGASNPTTIGSATGGAGAGKVSLSSFNFMKKTDKVSPVLFQACASGVHYDKVTVTMRKAGE